MFNPANITSKVVEMGISGSQERKGNFIMHNVIIIKNVAAGMTQEYENFRFQSRNERV